MNKYLKAAAIGASAFVGSILLGATSFLLTGAALVGTLVSSVCFVVLGSVAQSQGASFKQVIVGGLAGIAAVVGLGKAIKATLPNQGPFEKRTEVQKSVSFIDTKKTVHFNDIAAYAAKPAQVQKQAVPTQKLRV